MTHSKLALALALLLAPSLAHAQAFRVGSGVQIVPRASAPSKVAANGVLYVDSSLSNALRYCKPDQTCASMGTGSGSVTSVQATVPSFLSISGGPITTAGTLAITLATEAANVIFAGPSSGSAAAPTWRALVSADMPNTAVTPGSYTYTAFTVDAKGHITAASSGATPALAATTITAGTGLSGGGDLSTNRSIALANTAVTPAAYTNANITVDAQGRITAAANGSGGGGTTQTIDVINATAATAKVITSAAADSGTNVGTIINNSTAMTTRRTFEVQNAGTGLVAVRGDGTVIMELGSGQSMCAPAAGNCIQYYDSVLLVSGVGQRPAAGGEINGSAGTQCWGETGSRIYSTDVPTTKTISSNVLAPTHQITHVGAGLIKTITPPTFAFNGVLYFIPDSAFTYDETGNIVAPTGSAKTAIVNQLMMAAYDANTTKWYMSY